MATGFPCPNPNCSHVFPPGALAVGVLTCPRCGGQCQLQFAAPVYPAPPGAKPVYPVGRAVAPPPYPQAAAGMPAWGAPAPVHPVQAPPPVAPAAPPSNNAFRLDSQPDLTVRAPRRRGGGGLFFLVLLMLTLAGGGVYLAYEKGFRVNVLMPGNTETGTGGAERRSTEPLLGTRAVYGLKDDIGIWRKDAAAKNYYEAYMKDLAHVDLALQANDPANPNDREPATLLVFVLPRADNLDTAVAAAREVTKLKYKDYPGTRIEVLKNDQGEPLEQKANVGEAPGHIALLSVHNNDTRQRFVARAVVHRVDMLVMIHCECALDKRSAWEGYFERMLSSFRLNVRK